MHARWRVFLKEKRGDLKIITMIHEPGQFLCHNEIFSSSLICCMYIYPYPKFRCLMKGWRVLITMFAASSCFPIETMFAAWLANWIHLPKGHVSLFQVSSDGNLKITSHTKTTKYAHSIRHVYLLIAKTLKYNFNLLFFIKFSFDHLCFKIALLSPFFVNTDSFI